MAQLLRKTEDGREVYASEPVTLIRKEIDAAEGIYEVDITAEIVDRDEDIVRAAGAMLENYEKNPVVLFAHDYKQPPVAKSLKVETIKGQGLRARFQFPREGISERADEIRLLWGEGFLNAASIGFVPIEFQDVEGKAGRDFTKWELLEWSIVTVPANPEALRRALGAMDDEGEPMPEVKPYPNEHACRLRNPADFQPDSFRRTSRTHEGKKYSVIMGRLKGETTMTQQAFRYDKDVWTAAQAGSHCKAHDGRFEAATEERDISAAADDESTLNIVYMAADIQPIDELTDDDWNEIAEALVEILKLDNLRRFIKP